MGKAFRYYFVVVVVVDLMTYMLSVLPGKYTYILYRRSYLIDIVLVVMTTLCGNLLQLETLRQLLLLQLMVIYSSGSIFKMATEFWTKQGC